MELRNILLPPAADLGGEPGESVLLEFALVNASHDRITAYTSDGNLVGARPKHYLLGDTEQTIPLVPTDELFPQTWYRLRVLTSDGYETHYCQVPKLDVGGEDPLTYANLLLIEQGVSAQIPAGPTEVSEDPGNTAVLGTDGLVFVPAPDPVAGTGTDLTLGAVTETLVTVNSSTGLDVELPASTDSLAGVMTAAHSTKLTGIQEGAVAAGAAGDAFSASHPLATDPHPQYVPTSRTINGLPLTNDITVEAQGGFSSSYLFCDHLQFPNTVPPWHELERQSDGGAGVSHSVSTGNGTYVEMERYCTEPLNTTLLPGGNWHFTLFASCLSTTRSFQVKAEVYRVNSSGAIVGGVLGTAETSPFSNTTPVGLTAICFIAQQSGWDPTDRIGIVVSGKRLQNAGTLTWYHDYANGWASAVNTPLTLLHNQMNGLNDGDYVHLTRAEYEAFLLLIGN